MTIVAKFKSVCPCCSKPIRVGERVEWERGSKAMHVACAGKASGDTEATDAAADVDSAPAERTITVERQGRRSYLRGDTLAVRGLLRSGGCHWDADAKAWWIGSHEAALELAERAKTAEAEAAPAKRRTHCLQCGCSLDRFQQQRGFVFCSGDCAIERKMGSGWSGYVNGAWHQGSDD